MLSASLLIKPKSQRLDLIQLSSIAATTWHHTLLSDFSWGKVGLWVVLGLWGLQELQVLGVRGVPLTLSRRVVEAHICLALVPIVK